MILTLCPTLPIAGGKREVSFRDDVAEEDPLSRSWFNEQQAQVH